MPLDGLLTWGKGRELDYFRPAGVGKSTLLGMIARNTEAQVNIISLIGERGREVRDFLEKTLEKKVSNALSSFAPLPTLPRSCV